jgi:hypothetical protein
MAPQCNFEQRELGKFDYLRKKRGEKAISGIVFPHSFSSPE